MLLVYAPDAGERREWLWRPGDIESREAEAIEDATGWEWFEFGTRFMNGSIKAKRAALWTVLRRENPALRFDDVSFRAMEVAVLWEPAERDILRRVLADDDPDIAADQRADLLSSLEQSDTATVAPPEAVVPATARSEVPAGKDTGGDDAPLSGT